MFKSIYWYLKFIITLIMKTPALKRGDKIKQEQGQAAYDDYVYDISTRWAYDRLKDSKATIHIHGEEKIPMDKTVLFVSNHQSDFDIAVFMALIKKNTGFVAKIEMAKVPFLRDWMKAIHCVFMDRKDMKQSVQTILEGIKLLKAGYTMVVFPEGTRSKSGAIGEFKAGSFKLATKPKVPIVPVTIDGTYKIMEGNHYIIKPATVDVTIHDPIDTSHLTKEEEAALPEQVKAIIASAMKDHLS